MSDWMGKRFDNGKTGASCMFCDDEGWEYQVRGDIFPSHVNFGVQVRIQENHTVGSMEWLEVD